MRGFLSHFGGSASATAAGTVDGTSDGASSSLDASSAHGMYSDSSNRDAGDYERTFDVESGYDRAFMDKQMGSQSSTAQQIKAWGYNDVATRGGRSNSFPSDQVFRGTTAKMDPDMLGFPSRGGSAAMHLPRAQSTPDALNYEVTNGIMNTTTIPEVGNNDTQKHLRAKNLPSSVLFNSGRWSNEEHNRFVQGLSQFPHGVLNRWRKISKAVGTRTVLQTRTHAQKFFRKLQKQDDGGNGKMIPSDGEDENHLPNNDDKAAAAAFRLSGGSAFGSPASFLGKKDERLVHHRMSDPASYDPRPLVPLANHPSDSRNMFSQGNLFPSITIPSPSAPHPPQHPTPTTEASRAFQNISLGGRRDALDNTYPPPQQRGPGNEQWVDWLLSNIDTLVTRPGGGGRDDGRRGGPMPRAFRSASEPVPPLQAYRVNNTGDFQSSPQGQVPSAWENEGASSYSHQGGNNNAYYGQQEPADAAPEQKYSSMLDE
ncbi:Aste57867_8848 [Aphanomyces stellatus]|uniref:Aste57867_8848 protein n=1 Tax=Aphanomyces stellatus TaxID=120398 RepID=A0A485KL99_9STRA|nr:hypothetical protein As57867_008813 [Aphanomyces stellatus]VFT85734.1 Aste57867_8848 [Aphanomyces stellatus]